MRFATYEWVLDILCNEINFVFYRCIAKIKQHDSIWYTLWIFDKITMKINKIEFLFLSTIYKSIIFICYMLAFKKYQFFFNSSILLCPYIYYISVENSWLSILPTDINRCNIACWHISGYCVTYLLIAYR